MLRMREEKAEVNVTNNELTGNQIKTAREVINPKMTTKPARGTMIRLLNKPTKDTRLK